MRILVTGSAGMLGRNVCDVIVQQKVDLLIGIDSSVDIANAGKVGRIIKQDRPDVIINCAGKRNGPAALMLAANAIGPHILASFGIPMIHMSTDCVFSGKGDAQQWLSSERRPDPIDLYGRSKLAGEVQASHVVNVRGSFIGVGHGFLRWLLDAKGVAPVWSHAYWNGTSVHEMATQLIGLARISTKEMKNVLHVASKTCVSKAEMAKRIVEGLDLDVSLSIVDEPRIRRVLLPDIELEPVHDMLDRLLKA